MMATVAGRRKLSEARRGQILEAAAAVIGERGICDTRVADVAARAGTSSALILYYFESKDRLLAEALATSEDRFYEETARELQTLDSARDRLVRLIELSCAQGPAGEENWLDEWLLGLDVWALAPRDPDVARDRQVHERRWRDTIAGIVREGQAAGEFQPVDPLEFAIRLGALIDGLAIAVVLNDPDVNAPRMFHLCLAMAAQELGFEAPRRAPRRRGTRTKPAARSSRSPADRAAVRTR
jgi:AcrR family transcriptional regulator